MQPTPVFMPGKSHGPRSLGGYSPWGHKESDMTERLHFTSLHFTIFLPGKFHGQRSLVGYSPWGYKELDTTEHLHLTLGNITQAQIGAPSRV